MPASLVEKAERIKIAYDPRTIASEKANDGV